MKITGFSPSGVSKIAEKLEGIPPSIKTRTISQKELSTFMLINTIPKSRQVKNEIIGMIEENFNSLPKLSDKTPNFVFDIIYPISFIRKLAKTGHKKAERLLRKLQNNPKYSENIKQAAADLEEFNRRLARISQGREILQERVLAKKKKLNYFV